MKKLCLGRVILVLSVVSMTAAVQAGSEGVRSDAHMTVLTDFERQEDIGDLALYGDFAEATLNTDQRFIKSGQGSLRLVADNAKDGKPVGTPSFSMTVDPALDLEGYRAVGFWIYAPEETVIHFFGRNDVTLTIDGSRRFSKQWSPSPLRALSAGWSHYVWDFGELASLPEVNKITFSFSRLMEGYEQVELYVDEVALCPAEPIGSVEYLSQIIQKDADWTKRYKAVTELRKIKTVDVLEAVIPAIADESKLVRTTAVEVMTDITGALGTQASRTIKQAFENDNRRIRQAVLECAVELEGQLGELPQELFLKSLVDDCYYVRHLGFEKLLEKGATEEGVAADMLETVLVADDDQIRLKCIRMLDHIGPQAKSAVPALLQILRDENEAFILRGWALRTVWWLAEEKLTPADWAVGLSLKPGEIH